MINPKFVIQPGDVVECMINIKYRGALVTEKGEYYVVEVNNDGFLHVAHLMGGPAFPIGYHHSYFRIPK